MTKMFHSVSFRVKVINLSLTKTELQNNVDIAQAKKQIEHQAIINLGKHKPLFRRVSCR